MIRVTPNLSAQANSQASRPIETPEDSANIEHIDLTLPSLNGVFEPMIQFDLTLTEHDSNAKVGQIFLALPNDTAEKLARAILELLNKK
jgi:hypothetical protein